jgi:NAD(P)-dependent dehydrogenase (short-subunit alcohol dehydrogenase family)
MSGRVEGKVALVTGAGQSPGPRIGNGRATAILFAREGARVMLLDRDAESARETERAIAEEGGEAATVAGDVGVEEDCRDAVAACVERFGALDVVHHNVGVLEGDGWAEDIELEGWERIMRVNAGGALLIAKAAVPVLKERGGGAITNVSSIAAIVAGTKGTSNPPLGYKMSKAAMNAITQSLAQTYARDAIRVNAILPGLIDTPMAIDNVVRALGVPREEWVKRRDEAVPLKGGMGSAWDVAHAGLFLASDEARFITGVLLPVDGGQSSRVG